MRLGVENGEVPVGRRLGRVILTVVAVVAAATVVLATGIISLPGFSRGSRTAQASDQATLAAQRTAADKQWASATCTNILAWKNAINRDGTSLDLGTGPVARVKDAIAATTRLVSQLDTLGLPPGAQTGQARVELEQLRSDIQSRLRDIEGTVSSVAGGNFAAIGRS